ncbi:MAG TPA: hypothetical protein VGE21_11590 [Flavobacteriales bacterium]
MSRFIPYPAYPMLWVHFNSRGHVHEVYAKQYSGLEGQGIYMLKLDPCDTTDRTVKPSPAYYDETMALRQLQESF